MNISPILSQKIRFLSFCGMFSVVAIHCDPLIGTGMENARCSRMLSSALCHGLCTWAVPYFFIVSGFFALPERYSCISKTTLSIWRRKTSTLLLPYICWAAAGVILMFPLLLAREHALGYSWKESSFLNADGLLGKVDLLLGITSFRGPLHNEPLWYVRLLILLFAASPLWLALRKISRWILVPGILLVILLDPYGHCTIYHWLGSIGCFLAGISIREFGLFEKHVPGWCVVPVILLIIIMLGERRIPFLYSLHPFGFLLPLSLVLFMWIGYDAIQHFLPKNIHALTKRTFWVYCTHQPFCIACVALLHLLFGKSDGVNCGILLALPFLVTAMMLVIGYWVGRLLPRTYHFLTGGR